MRSNIPSLLFVAILGSTGTVFAEEPSADVKVGTGVEKMELQGEAKSFKVSAGTKLWVWTKVSGAAEGSISVVFEKDGKAAFKQELKVPRSPLAR